MPSEPVQMVVAVLGRGVVDPATPVLRADDAGVTRGDGCFEGIRVVADTAGHHVAAKLDRHLTRMTRSAAALDIAFDAQAWRALVDEACLAWVGADEAAMKLVLTRGPVGTAPTGFLTVLPVSADVLRQRVEGISAITLDRGLSADAFASAPWLLGGVKTLSYAVNMAALREAERRGAQDAIFVSGDGVVLEAPTASIVWANGRTLRTTPTGVTGILAGTTQQLLFDAAADDGWDVATALATVDDLHSADGLWSVSSVRGPAEIVDLDGKQRARRPDLDALLKRWAGF